MFQKKMCRERRNTCYVQSYFIEIIAVCGTVWNMVLEPPMSHILTWLMGASCWISKATNRP